MNNAENSENSASFRDVSNSWPKNFYQYRLLYTISNNIEVYEEPVPRTKKIP